jgi:ribonuclease HI
LIEVYTDGSCKPTNPGPAGFGCVILIDGEVFMTAGEFIGRGTNNIAEVKGIEYGLTALKSLEYNEEEIVIYTDSKYAIGLFSKNWKPKVNIELINKVREDLEHFSNLKFVWVKGHSGDKYNEMADVLAKTAIDSTEEI